jgi:thiol:disulfide interchange protein
MLRVRAIHAGALALGLLAAAAARASDPFVVTARLERVQAAWQVVVDVEMPPQHDLFADQRFAVQVDGNEVAGRFTPAPTSQPGPDGKPDLVFTSRFTACYPLATAREARIVRVRYQGCAETICFPPRTATFMLAPETTTAVAPAVSAVAERGATGWLGQVQVRGSAAGYLGREEFLAFLARARGQPEVGAQNWLRQFATDPLQFWRARGMVGTLLLMLLGGFLLNLTPCVLPMIPINLAIIGAGVRAGSRGRGLALGSAYGAGIALVYGALGVVVVLTGSFFGALQASPIFQGGLALLFLLLALAMFDLLPLDFSRFQPRGSAGGGLLTAAVAGGFSALLAGACVAPVVAAVLLLTGVLYHRGEPAALLLPFLLGVGMALPWPLAGAGLTVLPKPGAWMRSVKVGFGILIAALGLYYGWLAWGGVTARPTAAASGNMLVAGDAAGWGKWLAEARRQQKPLLLDFYASWCKNCDAMELTTFRDPAVRQALHDFLVVRVATERPSEEPAQSMVRAFGVAGLPTYVVVDAR